MQRNIPPVVAVCSVAVVTFSILTVLDRIYLLGMPLFSIFLAGLAAAAAMSFLHFGKRLQFRETLGKNRPASTASGEETLGEESDPLLSSEAEDALAWSDEDTPKIVDNINSGGIEFNRNTGEIVEIDPLGKRKRLGRFSEIQEFRFRADEQVIGNFYDYVIVWKDLLKPVTSFSPYCTRRVQLDVYRDEIVPKLDAMVAEYGRRHPEEPDRATTVPATSPFAPFSGLRLFRREHDGYRRTYRNEPLFFAVLAVGTLVWFFTAQYGWLGMMLLGIWTLLTVLGFYYNDKSLLILILFKNFRYHRSI